MRHMLGNLSPNYFERTKRYMMLRASRQGTDLTVSGTPPLSLPNSLGKPLKAWSVEVSPNQEGTGDPSPDNVRPIHGTDKVTITTAGVNLFNPVNVLDGYLTGTGSFTATTTGEKTFFAYLPAGQYTYSKPLLTTRARYCLFDTMPVNGAQGSIVSIGNWDNYHCSTTLTKPCYFVAWNYNNTGETYTLDEVLASTSINIGMTALPYEPYVGSTTSITLPQTVYTGTIGSEGGESRWGEVDLGTLTWTKTGSFFRTVIQDIAIGKNYSAIICSSYATKNSPGQPSQDKQISQNSSSGKSTNALLVYDTSYVSATDFAASVSGAQLVYELATPTTFAVPSATIPTPSGTATTWATAEEGTVDTMEVTYVGKA